MNKEILENMKKITKMVAEDPTDGMFLDNIEGDTGVPDIEKPEFRVKSSTLQSNGSLHIQLGHPAPMKIWSLMEKELGTPFAATTSDRVLRKYGVAFNIPTANGSIDQHEMQELGHRLKDQQQTTSFASPAHDSVPMVFVGVVVGKDNEEKDVKMLEFEIGDVESIGNKEQLFIAFSHLDVLRKHENENYPTIRQECLLAWLVANFVEPVEVGEDGE